MLLKNIKLKQARKLLHLTQDDVAKELGFADRTNVAKYETGKNKGIPFEYVDFLFDHGFDVNSFFDNSLKEIQFRVIDMQVNEPSASYGKCKRCQDLEAEIAVLKGQLKTICDVVQGNAESPKKNAKVA